MSELELIAHTGNVIKIFGGNAVTLGPSEELKEALKRSLSHSSCCTERNDHVAIVRSDFCEDASSMPTQDDSLTVKIFVHDEEHGGPAQIVRDSIQQLEEELGQHRIDYLFVYLPHAHSVSEASAEAVKVAFELKKSGRVDKVGVTDFCVTGLTRLHEFIHTYPDVNQVEVSRVCSLPPDLKQFCKEHGVEMVSHSDPRRLLDGEELGKILTEVGENKDVGKWGLRYVLRYNLTISHRGIIAAKGYIVSAFKEQSQGVNGAA